MHKPVPSTAIAGLALFVALGGVGVAANGDSFILGNSSNSATAQTALSASLDGPSLQISNPNTGSGSTPLSLVAASGHPAFKVNTGARVANLNADQLDGIDSARFWKLAGNGGTGSKAGFLGTTDGAPLIVQPGSGSAGIGTNSPATNVKLDVRTAPNMNIAVEGVAGSGGNGVVGTAGTAGVGVRGTGIGADVIGVIGTGSTTGVRGESTSPDAAGVTAVGFGASEFSLDASGNTRQAENSAGLVKALAFVGGNSLIRCFRGDLSATTFTVVSCSSSWAISGSGGSNTITFPFAVSGRFVVVTPNFAGDSPVMATYDFPSATQVRVRTWTCSTGPTYTPCGLISSGYTVAVF